MPRKGPVLFVAAPHANQVTCLPTNGAALEADQAFIVCRSFDPHASHPHRSSSENRVSHCREIDAKEIHRSDGTGSGRRFRRKSFG